MIKSTKENMSIVLIYNDSSIKLLKCNSTVIL